MAYYALAHGPVAHTLSRARPAVVLKCIPTAAEGVIILTTRATAVEGLPASANWAHAALGLIAGCAAAFAASFAADLFFGSLLGEYDFPVRFPAAAWSLLALLNGVFARAVTGRSRGDALPYGICGAIAALSAALKPSAVDAAVASTVLVICAFLWFTSRDRSGGAATPSASGIVLGTFQACLIVLVNGYFIVAAGGLLMEECHIARDRTLLYWLTLGQIEALFRSGLWPWFWFR